MTPRRPGRLAGGALARRLSVIVDEPRRPLVLLVLAAVLPLLLFEGWVAAFSAERTRADTWRAASETVGRVANRVAAELAAQRDVAVALAASTALDDDDLPRFRLEAERVRAARPLWHTIELTSPAGMQLLNLLRPEGEALGPTADLSSLRAAVRTGEPAIGGIGPVGAVSGRRLVTLRVPVLRRGALRSVLSVAMAPNSVGHILAEAGAPPAWIGVVVDATGAIIARTVAAGEELGRPASITLRQAMARAPAGHYRGRTLEGEATDTIYRALPGTSGWTVAFGVPVRLLQGPVRRSLALLGLAGSLGLALSAALVSLVAKDLRQRREDVAARATRALHASEQGRVLALEAAELGTWWWEAASDRFGACPRARALLGLPDGEDDAPLAWSRAMLHVPEADRAGLRTAAASCLRGGAGFSVEFRVARPEEGAGWVRAVGRTQRSEGQAPRLQGVLSDTTAGKRAELERLDLRRRLAQAQEEERRRISRELHDQVGQTVTGLSLGLKAMEGELAGLHDAPGLGRRLRWLQSLTADIGRDLHRAAADLRPTVLDDFGLPGALEALAAEWAERHGLAVDVEVVGPVGRLPPEVETALFRVVQEALTNVLKHAGARDVSVLLERTDGWLRLVVEDDGVGFDVDRPPPDARRRLGLSGMRERLALVGGTLTLESSSGGGTALFVKVPGAVAAAAAPAPVGERAS